MNFENELFSLLSNVKQIVKTQPICLGGYSGENGGGGGPPAGFIGQLPQGRITFDTTEAESNVIAPSGSLLDNLNRIRYRIKTLEDKKLGVKESGTVISNDVTYLNFLNATITDIGGGEVTISGEGGGSGGGSLSVEDNDVVVSSNVVTLNFENLVVTDNGENKVTVAAVSASGVGIPIGGILPYAGSISPAGFNLCDGTELLSSSYSDLSDTLGYVYGHKITVVNLDDDYFILEGLNTYTTGQGVRFTSTESLPSPLSNSTEYFVRRDGVAVEYTIHPTQSDAENNTNKIDLTTAGEGLLTIQKWGYVRIPDMRGKFPLGNGTGTSQTQYIRGQRGGEEVHVLTKDEMPAHSHTYTYRTYYQTEQIGITYGTDYYPYADLDESIEGDETSSVGNSNSHNNMPPYLVLNYIIRIL